MNILILYFISIFIISIGIFLIIINLNSLIFEYTLWKFVKFIISRSFGLFVLFGTIIIVLIYEKGLK